MNKITIKEFFESAEDLAIHCDTEEKAKKLLEAFDKKGYQFCEGVKYTDLDVWYLCKEETCYTNKRRFCDREFYQSKGYKILEFEEIELRSKRKIKANEIDKE